MKNLNGFRQNFVLTAHTKRCRSDLISVHIHAPNRDVTSLLQRPSPDIKDCGEPTSYSPSYGNWSAKLQEL